MNDPSALLADFEEQIRQSNLSLGVGKLDELLALQGKVEDEALQLAYIRSIIILVGKNPADSVLEDLHDRLQKTPAYIRDEQCIADHGRALVEAADRAPDYRSSLQRAQAIPTLKGYGFSEALQAAHAEALFRASEKLGAKTFELVGMVSNIPSFRDSAEIQFAAARMLCNYTGQATSLRELNQAIERLENLPLLAQESRLQESLERAKRNRERFLELKPEVARSISRKHLAVGGGVLGVLLVGGLLLSKPDKPATPRVTATPVQAQTGSPEQEELEKYLSKSTEAYEAKKFEDAGLYAGMALKRAETLKDEKSQARCYDLLASSTLHRGEKTQLKLLDKIPEGFLPAIAETHLKAAEQYDHDNQNDSLKTELTILLYLAEHSKVGALDTTLEKAYSLCEKRKFQALGGFMQLHFGHFDKAAELAESSGNLELAEKLLARLAGADKMRATAAGKEAGAKAHTILAKSDYLKGDYKGALEHAQVAYQDAPNADRKERLAAYKFKDASIVTLDELNVDTFVFPPAQKTGEYYTYFYTLKSGYKHAPQETLLQPPKDEFATTVVYGSSENGVVVLAEAYTGGGFSAAFDADQNKALAPGLYENATRFPYNNNNPGMEFNDNGSGYGRSRGKFKVHEIRFQGEELAAFAVDFIYDREGKYPEPVFGKIRYNSHFK